MTTSTQVGGLLRDWRRRRRLSQLDLALEAGISTRHLSFVETGRSRPSAEMVLLLADELDVPLRERNQLLLAAGYAPQYGELSMEDDEMTPVREALQLVLSGHEPFPACAVDRQWELVAANRGIALLLDGVADETLLQPPVNVLRLTLHPEGMAPRILNLAQWRAHLLARLERELALTGDAAIAALFDELVGYPGGDGEAEPVDGGAIAVPLRLLGPDGTPLTFINTVSTFGTAVDVTVAELSIESFFPADAPTRAAVTALLAD